MPGQPEHGHRDQSEGRGNRGGEDEGRLRFRAERGQRRLAPGAAGGGHAESREGSAPRHREHANGRSRHRAQSRRRSGSKRAPAARPGFRKAVGGSAGTPNSLGPPRAGQCGRKSGAAGATVGLPGAKIAVDRGRFDRHMPSHRDGAHGRQASDRRKERFFGTFSKIAVDGRISPPYMAGHRRDGALRARLVCVSSIGKPVPR